MKLTYILNKYSPADATHFTHILHLLEVMAEKGCAIVLVVEKVHKELPTLAHPGITVVGLRTRAPVLRHAELFFILLRLIRAGYAATFVRIAAPASIIASLAHRLCGGTSLLWQSGTTHLHDSAQPLSLSKVKWILTSVLPNALARKLVHRFVTGPESMVQYYADVVGVPRRKITLLYNDINLERFAPDPAAGCCMRAVHGIGADELVLLIVHRLSPVRRTLTYLAPALTALKSGVNRPWRLIVAGGGSELQNCKDVAAEQGLTNRVIFLGDIPNAEIPRLYSAAHVFLHPTYTEGFPRVVIEAMAAGLPIVTTDAGGTRELLGPLQQKYVSMKGEPAAFARGVLQVIRNANEWGALSAESRRVVRRFSTATVADMYLEALFGNA